MDELKRELNFSQYINVFSPSEIDISKEQIFFRKK